MPQAVIGALRVNMATNAGEFTRGMRKAESTLARFSRTVTQVGIKVAVLATVLRELSIGHVQAWAKQEKAIRLVEATLRSTGQAAGFTSSELQKLASEMQGVSEFGDEDILKQVTNNLLTFGNVTGQVFVEAQRHALNLSTVLDQGLKESAIQVGKALNDPIKGVTALSRVGIRFTEEQKEMIKRLQEQNDMLGAQTVILDELEKFYGQAAKAARESVAGEMTAAANAMGDAWEEVGRLMAPLVISISKGIQSLSATMIALMRPTQEVKDEYRALFGVFERLGAVLNVVITPFAWLLDMMERMLAIVNDLANVIHDNLVMSIVRLQEALGLAIVDFTNFKELKDELAKPVDIGESFGFGRGLANTVTEIEKATEAMNKGIVTSKAWSKTSRSSVKAIEDQYAGFAQEVMGSLETVFGQNKAVSIASALVNTYAAVTKALATYPPPFSYAAAAAALAAGMAQVRNIQQTTSRSTGGGGSVSRPGTGGPSGGEAAADQTAGGTVVQIEGINTSDLFSRDTVAGLLETISDIQRDGGRVVMPG